VNEVIRGFDALEGRAHRRAVADVAVVARQRPNVPAAVPKRLREAAPDVACGSGDGDEGDTW
jgi:hypothetical protein